VAEKMMPSSASERSFPNESRKDTKNIDFNPAIEDVIEFPNEYDCNAEAESVKIDTLKGEFKIDKNSELGKVPTSSDISRKYDPAAVARKEDE